MQKIILIFIIIIFVTNEGNAYLGPGVGGGIIMATLGVIVAIFVAIFGILWFPLKRLIKRKKYKTEEKKQD